MKGSETPQDTTVRARRQLWIINLWKTNTLGLHSEGEMFRVQITEEQQPKH